MIKYKTCGNRIEEVEVTKETEHFVYLPSGRREANRSEWQNYFNTKAEARDHLITQSQRHVDGLRRRLEIAKRYLGNAKGIKV